MRQGILVIFGLVVLFLAGASAARAETRVALVIGNDDYTALTDLNNARKDAEGMAAKLRVLGFDVVLRLNATERSMGRALADFENRLAKAEVGLVFYAGHGIQADGRNYLIPADAQVEIEEDLPYEGLDSARFLEAMKRAGSRLNIVILDACRDNPLPRRTRSAARGLAVVPVPKGIQGTAILYSAAPGQTAQDGPKGDHGVFTGELLQALDTPGLKLEDVFKRTATAVAARTHGKQDPWFHSSIKGDFFFRSGENAAAVTSAPTGGAATEVAFWQSIQESADAADFKDYLSQFPEGAFTRLAKRRLAALTPEQPPAPSRDRVRRIQQLLADLGYQPGPVDGRMGSRTRKAIEKFQLTSGMMADGEVTDALMAGIESARKPLASKPPAVATAPQAAALPTEPIPTPRQSAAILEEARDALIGVVDLDSPGGMDALQAVAMAQAAAGDIDGAVETALRVSHATLRRDTLILIATEQSAADDLPGALTNLARWMKQEKSRKSDFAAARARLLVARVEAGDVGGAMAGFRALGFEENYWRLQDVVKALAERGEIEKAEAIAHTMVHWKNEAIMYIAKAQARAGDVAAALTTARGLPDYIVNVGTPLLAVAREQLNAGDKRGARVTVYEILKPALKKAREAEVFFTVAYLIIEAAVVLARTGDTGGAKAAMAEAIGALPRIDPYADHALRDAAIAYAEMGRFDDALATAKLANDEWVTEQTLTSFAEAQATAGNIEEALSIARKPDWPKTHGNIRAFLAAARALANSGKTAEARAVFEEAIEAAGSTAPTPMEMIAKARTETGDFAGAVATFRHPYYKHYLISYDHSMEFFLDVMNKASPEDAALMRALMMDKLPDARAEEDADDRTEELALIAAVLAKAEWIEGKAR